MEIIAYLLLPPALFFGLGLIFFEMIKTFPEGLAGIIILLTFSLLFIKVPWERLRNKADDHYQKSVVKYEYKTMITTHDSFEDHEISETQSLVKGNTVHARHLGKDIVALFRNLVGREIPEYTKMLAESREQAFDRMVEDTRQLGADGIVCVRFTTSAVMQGAAEILVYSTAVKLINIS